MADKVSVEERLKTNYNATGVAVMQAMYGDDYLSIGGNASTDELAALAGITQDSLVLDVGCGIGGPALRLASSVRCPVIGIDLVAGSASEAQRLANHRLLGNLASFTAADATALPLGSDSFDVVWGQDAWCHVPDKPTMLTEAARVLRPGGRIAFTDWLAGTGMSGAERAAALDAAVSRHAASAERYHDLLAEAGFTAIEYTDISDVFTEQYRAVYRGLRDRKAEFVDRFGARVYTIVADVNGTILRGFEGAAITGGRFLATKA